VTLLSFAIVEDRLFTKWQMGYLGEMDFLDIPWDEIIALRYNGEHDFEKMMQRWLILLDSPKVKT